MFDPLLEAETVGDGLFEAIDGFLGPAEERVIAGHVIEDAGIIRLDRQRTARPFQGSLALANLRKSSRAQLEGTRIVRV